MDEDVKKAALIITSEFTPVLERILAERMEQVFATVEELRADVASAVEQVRDTAQVLVDNDTAIMARVMERDGDQAAAFVTAANQSWARFVRQEAETLGWRVLVPKVREMET